MTVVMALIFFPPGPIIRRIMSGFTKSSTCCGAYLESCFRGSAIALAISPSICRRPSCACCMAARIISVVNPVILMSICTPVTPSAVPAILKSMSPRASSSPRISVRTINFSPSLISPIATPATGALIGTPASMSEREPPHTAAIDDEPLDSTVSVTTRTVKGKSSSLGSTGRRDFSASAP